MERIGQPMPSEAHRLQESVSRQANWQRWGPYLAERQWATVREDYSADGACWDYFPHDHARSRAYRWGEDGLLGICDRQCRLCFSVALWNGRDAILKERLFGLTGSEGNHGEDVKECYYYLDATPTYSWMTALYKYPQAAFPYELLVAENARRGRQAREYELEDTGVFDGGRYWDVQVSYAKASPDDILIKLTVSNRGPVAATLTVLPTLWFRNTWVWGCQHEGCGLKPSIRRAPGDGPLLVSHESLGEWRFAADEHAGQAPTWLFTDNESNSQRLWGVANFSPYVKDAFDRYLIHGEQQAVNPAGRGTKAAAMYRVTVAAGGSTELRLRLYAQDAAPSTGFGLAFDQVLARRQAEAEAFYRDRLPSKLSEDHQRIMRQAYAGLLWSKQFYHYIVGDWLAGDRDMPPPPASRRQGRNADWQHLYARDVLSMPDKWEYPWFAAWDTAFHMVSMARVDPEFAKQQLLLLLREWYLHPNGQIPAYEFALGDVNPPVHAWAAWRVYKLTAPRGQRDLGFLERIFQKLLMNFTWWVNRKDESGKHLFSGGFLGLDNIGVFDRGKPLPGGGRLEQADGTAWMAFYCSTMLAMALELAQNNPAYEDIASKFFEHFVAITDAMNTLGGAGLWDETDGFYYDRILTHEQSQPLRVRSMVGLIPLFACVVLEEEQIRHLPDFKKRLDWFLRYRSDLARHITYMVKDDGQHHRLLAIPRRERLERVLRLLLDEQEFLAPYGIRSLSLKHREQPFILKLADQEYCINYVPGESTTEMFGGNSNWRGPIWFPVNYLLIEALERYHYFYGDQLKVEYPTGSGHWLNLKEVAVALSRRLLRLFERLPDGRRPAHGEQALYRDDPHWRDLLLFYEYFDPDSGRGCGAPHQTGWTALITRLVEKVAHSDAAASTSRLPDQTIYAMTRADLARAKRPKRRPPL